MLLILGLVNLANLIAVLTIKYGNMIGKADLQLNETDNIMVLLGLTILLFAEMIICYFELFRDSSLLMIRLIPTICEYIYVFRLFNRSLLYLHLPRERKYIIRATGSIIVCRIFLAYFYMDRSLVPKVIVPLLEISISISFAFSCYTVLGHFSSLNKNEIPQWMDAEYQEEVEIFKISRFHRKVNAYCCQSLHAFILNGTLWIFCKDFFEKLFALQNKFEYEQLSQASRVFPHFLILSNYLILYFRDKNYLRKDKTLTFELKETLVKPED